MQSPFQLKDRKITVLNIKPQAILVCGLIATSPNGACTLDSLCRRMVLSKGQMLTLLRAMQESGMIQRSAVVGFADEYTLLSFEANIGP